MGNLPRPRVTATRPFTNTGVDYAGPVIIKTAKGRGTKTYKGYISVFICLGTKAIHLEAVSDLTAEAFIAAFKRFAARRGFPHKIFSDNATNFQLASKILEKNETEFKEQYQDKLLEELRNYEVEWSFIPPAAPHFGGIWEAGVKSMKYHLKRTLGQTALTFEELATLLASVEACLNSRPLCPMTDDPNDISCLTPGHFLIGSPLLAPPGKELKESESISMRSRWKLLEHLNQQIWKKWSNEYLHRLQCRPKWTEKRDNVKVNDLVLVKDEALPPAQWSLGRVEEVHPGNDNLTRVVTLRTRNKLIKRPLAKICSLPVNEAEGNTNSFRPKRTIENHERLDEIETRSKKSKRQSKIHPVTGYSNLVKDNVPVTRKTEKAKEGNTIRRQHSVQRSKMGNVALFLILAIILVPALAEHPQSFIEVTPFKNHPGIYFETLGEPHLITSEWNIVTYYDLKQYWQELQGIRNCIADIHRLCNSTIIQRNYCLAIHGQFERQLKQIEEANELMRTKGLGVDHNLRLQRSPLNIVGKAANLLFGILDADYADELDKKLMKAQKNEDHLLQLIKNQTSLVEVTTNVMRERDEAIQMQFKIIQDHVVDLIHRTERNEYNQETVQIFNSLTSHTTLVLNNFERIQRSILDVLIDLHHGRINPFLITPSQLKSQISFIRENIPTTLALPENGQETTLLLYSLMTAAVRLMESRIIFQIKLPLLQNERYQLLHLVPVPTPHEGHFTFIEPETPYLIVNLHRDSYYPLTQIELDKCLHLETNQYLCQKTHPMYNSNSDKGRCELNLLKHVERLSSDCNIRTMKPSKIWIQLQTPNTWLYVMEKEYTFNIVCGSIIKTRTIRGEGILKIRQDCELKQESMTIGGHGFYTTQLNASFIPSLNISQLLTNLQSQPKEISVLEQHWQPNNDAYAAIRRRISDIRQKEKLPDELSSHDLHLYIISYLLVTIILSAAGFRAYRYLSNRRNKQTRQDQVTDERTWNLPLSESHI